jgi:hypothetical protein
MTDSIPKGLFSRIITRLGLEKELVLVKRYLGFFSVLLAVFIFLSFFAFIGIKQVLAESSFGLFLSLIFTDPLIVARYWKSFVLASVESVPGITFSVLFFFLACLLLFLRLTASSAEKIFILIKTINKQKYEHK